MVACSPQVFLDSCHRIKMNRNHIASVCVWVNGVCGSWGALRGVPTLPSDCRERLQHARRWPENWRMDVRLGFCLCCVSEASIPGSSHTSAVRASDTGWNVATGGPKPPEPKKLSCYYSRQLKQLLNQRVQPNARSALGAAEIMIVQKREAERNSLGLL